LVTKLRWHITLIAAIVIVLVCVWGEVFSVEVLTDEEKRQKVMEMYEDYKRSSFPDIEDIAPEEALKFLEQGKALFVDVRSHDEQEISKLPGAISEKEFREDPNAYPDRIIIACWRYGL